jgi:hypothetical protein
MLALFNTVNSFELFLEVVPSIAMSFSKESSRSSLIHVDVAEDCKNLFLREEPYDKAAHRHRYLIKFRGFLGNAASRNRLWN